MKPVYCIIFSLGLLSLIACSREYGYTTEENTEGKTIEFVLAKSTTETATRAIEDVMGNEGAINRLDIFFFDTDGECLYYPNNSQLRIDDNQQGDVRKVTISIPETTYNDVLEGEECIVYLVANYPANAPSLAGKTFDQVKNQAIENADDRVFNTSTPPADFIMTGRTSMTMNLTDQTTLLGEKIILKRTAAKVVVNIINAGITDKITGLPKFTAMEARVNMFNYLDKANVDGDSPFAAAAGGEEEGGDYRNAKKTLTRDNTAFLMDQANAFYSYPNDWNQDITKETYILLEVDWLEVGTETPKTYYYRIPFSYIRPVGNAGDHKNRIRSNFVYEFKVDISVLGGFDPSDAVDLLANFDIIDWETGEVVVSILEYHYLFIYSPNAKTSENSYNWNFISSLPAEIEITKAMCTVYTNPDNTVNLQGRVIDYMNDPRLMLIHEEGSDSFGIQAWTPNNYVPLEIEVTLRNAANLEARATLSIQPREFVTVTFSDPSSRPGQANWPQSGAYNTPTGTAGANWGANYPNGPGNAPNLNFYEVNITSVMDQTIWLGRAADARPMLVGDPTIPAADPYGRNLPHYVTDPAMNHVVSPQFVMASRRGATGEISWVTATDRCKRYRESQYPAGTWRVPTYAELALIIMMQRDPNSAIKNLLGVDATTWWTAQQQPNSTAGYKINAEQYRSYTETTGVITGTGNVPVRCVRDTWRVFPHDEDPTITSSN